MVSMSTTTMNHSKNTIFFSPSAVLMIRPACFGWNEQTAVSNIFVKINTKSVHEKALKEFDDVVSTMRSYGVEVVVIDDFPLPYKPDAMFPTWLSFHCQYNGVAFLYPMMAENRRPERRLDILEKLSLEHGFQINKIIDLTSLENDGEYLEGCGSLVLDRINRIGYAALSSRTTLEALGRFSQKSDYKIMILQAHDDNGTPLHHTNLMMSVAHDFVVICSEAITKTQNRNMILSRLDEAGHEIINISLEQMKNFAANIVQLKNSRGEKITFMSEGAYNSLDMEQIKAMAKYGKVVPIAIPTIEDVGGASIGTMITPICLPKKASRTARATSKITGRVKKQAPSVFKN